MFEPADQRVLDDHISVRGQALQLLIDGEEDLAARVVTESGVVFGLSLRVRSKLATIGGCVLKHRHEIVAGAFVTNRLKRLCSELVGINPQKLRRIPRARASRSASFNGGALGPPTTEPAGGGPPMSARMLITVRLSAYLADGQITPKIGYRVPLPLRFVLELLQAGRRGAGSGHARLPKFRSNRARSGRHYLRLTAHRELAFERPILIEAKGRDVCHGFLAHPTQPFRLLCARREGPRDRRSAEHRYELPPPDAECHLTRPQ